MPAAEDGYASRKHENLIRKAAGLPVIEDEPEKPFSFAEMLRDAGAVQVPCEVCDSMGKTARGAICQACQGTGFQPLAGEAVEF